MLVTTTDSLSPHRVVVTLGLVRGSAIRSRHVFHDFTEWVRNLVGAELRHYVKMMAETREEALDRMIAHARMLDADAVLGVQFATTSITRGSAELLAYGTAVKLDPTPEGESQTTR